MLLCFLFHVVSLYTLLIPMGLLCIGHPILAGTALSMAIDQTEDKGNGSAVMNFISMSMPVLMTLLLGLLHIGAAWIMPAIFLISLILMSIIYLFMVRDYAPNPK